MHIHSDADTPELRGYDRRYSGSFGEPWAQARPKLNSPDWKKRITTMLMQICVVAGFFLLLSIPTDAGLVLNVSDNGSNLTLSWSGSLTIGTNGSSTFSYPATSGFGDDDYLSSNGSPTGALSLDGTSFGKNTVGTASNNNPMIISVLRNSNSTNGVGTGFGFLNGSIYWDDSFGSNPGTIAPTRSWTFFGRTVASTFGTNLNSGPIVLWTHNQNGQTISIAKASAVPEPSAAVLVGLALVGCGLRRRRKLA